MTKTWTAKHPWTLTYIAGIVTVSLLLQIVGLR